MMIRTEAWVLHPGGAGAPDTLVKQEYRFAPPQADEVLVKPLYGCWEGNMTHAIKRTPLDLCLARDESLVVPGNAGVVEVLEAQSSTGLSCGDRCLVFCNGEPDEHGYPRLIYGYDAPGTIGLLAKLTKLKARQLIKLPSDSPLSIRQWAAFSLRYITAWANWRVALGCWRAQMNDCPAAQAHVLSWGGGVGLAELSLARLFGHPAAMVASRPSRLALIESQGIAPIDRRAFSDAGFEAEFLSKVGDLTDGQGAAIFVDNIGAHYRSTLKALARQGVLTTSGWKHGLTFPVVRASECIDRHIHVYTHYARRDEGEAAVAFAQKHGWAPPEPDKTWHWDEVPALAQAYAGGQIDDYFPLYAIHPH
ncbi:MAG: zinc-binding alcohol dehydrogenase family protein [Aquabacterium sp.]